MGRWVVFGLVQLWFLTFFLYSHALKARINSKDALAKALEIAYKELKTHIEMRESDLDQEIKVRLGFLISS